jgi:hypothetical protein
MCLIRLPRNGVFGGMKADRRSKRAGIVRGAQLEEENKEIRLLIRTLEAANTHSSDDANKE